MQFKEIIDVYIKKYMKSLNALCEQSAYLLTLKQVVHILITGLL
jgi:hypothetical protein